MNYKLFGSLFVRGGAAFCALLMHTLVAKIFEPSQAGWFYLAFTIITLSSVLCRQGFDEVVIKEIGASVYNNDYGRVNEVYKTVITNITLASILGAFLLVAMGCVLKFLNNSLGTIIITVSPSLVFFSLYSIHAQLLQGRFEAIKSTVVLSFISQVSFCIFLIVFPIYDALSGAIAFDCATGLAAISGFLLWFLYKEPLLKWKKVNKTNLLDSSLPIWIVAIAQQLIMWGGQFIASLFVSPVDIAAYNLFMRYSIVLQFFLLFASLIYSPQVSAFYSSGEKNNLQLVVKKVNLSLLLVSAIVLIFLIGGGRYIISFFGETYRENASVFYILVVGQALNTMLGFSSFILMMCCNEKILRNIVILNLPFVLVAYLLMTYSYGIIGTSIVTGSALLIQNLASILVIYKKLSLKFW